jgi:hypothetical protein
MGVLTNAEFRIIMPSTVKQNQAVKPRFSKGQKVLIKAVGDKNITQREADINEFSGKVGEVTNFYFISPRTEQIFYIYKVLVGDREKKEIVVYEDELEPVLW